MKFSIKSILLSCLITGILATVLVFFVAIVGGILFGKDALMSLPKWTGAFVWIPLMLFHGYLLHRFSGSEKFVGTVILLVGVSVVSCLFGKHVLYNIFVSLFLGVLFLCGGAFHASRA